MKIIIKTKKLSLDDNFLAYIEQKFTKLAKFLRPFQSSDITVEMIRETLHHKKGNIFMCRATASLPKKILTADSRGSDIKSIVVETKEILEREIRKYRTKHIFAPRKKTSKKR